MLFDLFLKIACNLYYFALHVTGAGAFPPPLSAKKEEELLKLYRKTGDEDAKNKLIEHNLRLVAHIVKKYYSAGCDQDDLISIGTIGLIKAVMTFNSDKGIRLATYAARCIENEILMYFRSIRKTSQDVYISEPIETDRDGNSISLIDVIADNVDIEEKTDTKLKLEHLSKIIGKTLDEREYKIICLRYGLNGNEEMTQKDIARLLNISRSYVSRIEKAALEKLRKQF